MRSLAATELLSLWERAAALSTHERALELLSVALPGSTTEACAALDLGSRDWHLLRLRAELFGSEVAGYGDCPHCGERLEIGLDVGVYTREPLPTAPDFVDTRGNRYRLPNTLDLIEAARSVDAEHAERVLFARCALGGGAGVDTHDVAEVDAGLATLARERGVILELACAECAGAWTQNFDPVPFLWEEINARALALLDEVHQLAANYGWSERDILTMSDVRRRAYLARLQ